MQRISIDISECETVDDFYGILLTSLDAPDWHGRNLDALWDSITSDINNVMPPYSIEVSVGTDLSQSVAVLLPRVKSLFDEAREQEHIEVEFKVGYPLLQATVSILAILIVAVNLAVDLVYGLIDPRIRVT